MFMTHHAPPNGLDPGDKMPGASGSIFDEMDELMADWSWRGRQTDPGYVYGPGDRLFYEMFTVAYPGLTVPALCPWSFPAYRGPVAPPPRIGVTR